jgi:hypothetical protein
MPKVALVFAALLITLGAGAFAISGSRTALLPTFVGGALAVLAGLALAFAGARRHLMHAAAVVALLGAAAPAAALAIRAAQMSPLALGVNVGMLALSAALLAMMVRSFILARRSAAAGSPGDDSRR